MQDPQADTSKSKRVGVDEQFIKFKSSPNLMKMKKFIRLKIDNIETTSQSPTNPPDPLPPELEREIKIKPEVQLVTDSLEPSSSEVEVPTKMESEKVEYQVSEDSNTGLPQKEETTRVENYVPENAMEESDKPLKNPIMCRDFVRGTCRRPGTCKYVHKCDPSQLFGVYTFCRNFQNKVCTLPYCKYVHATIFEEQEFYRTAKLPPHVLAPKNLMPPPPPPPPRSPPAGGRVEIPTSFSNPPPPIPSMEGPPPMLQPPPIPPNNIPDPNMFMMDEFRRPPGAIEACEPPRKKCKFCDILTVREQFHKEMVEERQNSVNDYMKKILEAEKKCDRLSSIVANFFKLMGNFSSTSSSGSLFNSINDQNLLVDQLLKLNSNRLSSISEESRSSVLGENYGMATLMAKLLCEEQAALGGGDPSRGE